MYNNIKLSIDQERDIILHVSKTADAYRKQLAPRHETLLDIYKTVTSFKAEQDDNTKWKTRFLVNKSHEVINKVLPKIIARSPKWIVSQRSEHFDEEDATLSPEELTAKNEAMDKVTEVIQDYLTYTFDKHNLAKVAKLWAKKNITYGDAFAKVEYKYEIGRTDVPSSDVSYDENGNEIITPTKKVKEDVVAEYPTMVIPSWTEMLYDPRIMFVEDMSSIIESKDGIRMSYFTKNKKKYFNLDKLIRLGESKDVKSFKERVFAMSGIQLRDGQEVIDHSNLNVKYYYGLYDLNSDGHGEGEKMYEFCVINDIVLVSAREIAQYPYEQIKCFDDAETNFGVGFVEPIQSLQDEMNFKKNNAAEYILKSTYRSFIWNPNSGISPKSLIDKPNNIIVTDKNKATVEENLWELPQRSIDSSYFTEQNDFERQLQAISFTVDTGNSRNDQALTNTATGIKVKYYENNAVIDEVRKSFEAGLERIAYKILQCAYDNMTDNIVIKMLGDEGFWEINKEMFRDAIRRYDIKIEAGSSSYDSSEQRKGEAVDRRNIMKEAMGLGVPVDLIEGFKDVLGTFEKPDIDRFIKKPEAQGLQLQQPTGAIPGDTAKPMDYKPIQETLGAIGQP